MMAAFQRTHGWLVVALILFSAVVFAGEGPTLPEGLAPAAAEKKGAGPALPEGIEASRATEGAEMPDLPTGLEPAGQKPPEKPVESATAGAFKPELPEGLHGFVEGRVGTRMQRDRHEKTASIAETRLQLEFERQVNEALLKLTADFLADPVARNHRAQLEEGEGWLDLREANVSLSPFDFMDVKVGRQILTWGTGDLVFINDLFPKDWNSFFIGRDDEYLKAPSDAAKVSLFSDLANLDIVFTPRFDADRFIDGERISFYNSAFLTRTGQNAIVKTDRPDRWGKDNELALRLYRVVQVGGRSYELAAYGYRGFWKSPAGMNAVTGRSTYPKLSVYGASARGPVPGLKGIGNVEVGYYDSRNDRSGRNRLVRNSELRFLLGYEQEVATDFTVGVQYYLEHMMDYGNYRRSLSAGVPPRDENRHLLTLRLTKLLMNQNLTLSLFTFYSPSDKDCYLRPKINYKVTDRWSAEVGGNVFFGREKHTFFGQFSRNSNVYCAVRYSF